jgi:hypothetical protein
VSTAISSSVTRSFSRRALITAPISTDFTMRG